MSARLRLIMAAAIVLVSALGGAAYTSRAAAESAVAISGPTLDLNALLGAGGGDANRRVIESAYDHVEHVYYQPVQTQKLFDGETRALNEFLKAKKVAGPGVVAARATGDRSTDLAAIEKTVSDVATRYPKVANRDIFTQVAVGGMLGGLGDPYTTYLSAREIRSLDEQLKGGNFGGIGVYIFQDRTTGAILVEPIEGNPAIKAGLKTGDVILAVDRLSTSGKKLDEIERAIRGPQGTVVSLRVRHHSGPKPIETVSITRADVHVPSVHAKIEDNISYVRLADFGATSAEEIRTAFVDGKKRGVRGFILDLRNNGGGYLDAAVDISSLAIPQGTIVSTIDRAGHKDERAANGRAIGLKPLVVLVNKYTASASEITAGALQDYHAATIVGTKTYGKGVVQSIYSLPDSGALKITTARYVTPLGRDIHHKGISPDVYLDQCIEKCPGIIDTTRDRQLALAKTIVRKKDQQ